MTARTGSDQSWEASDSQDWIWPKLGGWYSVWDSGVQLARNGFESVGLKPGTLIWGVGVPGSSLTAVGNAPNQGVC